MSHSSRHVPIAALAGGRAGRSEKADKRRWNRRLRHLNRVRVACGQECVALGDVTNRYTGAKDGKAPFHPDAFPQLMRK